jgi:hypothetical protein
MNEGQIIGILLVILASLAAYYTVYYLGGRKSNPNVELPIEIFNSLKNIASKKGITPEEWVSEQVLKNDSDINTKLTDESGIVFHDLDYLAGTWTDKDAEEFEQATSDFNKIEERLWR